MVPKIYDGLLLSTTTVNGAQTGSEYAVENCGRDLPTHLTFEVEMSAGTGTWILEGRNNGTDGWQAVDTGTAAKSEVVARFKRYRIRWSASSGLTSRASLGAVLRFVA